MDSLRTGPRVRAPELIDGQWLNSSAPLTLAGLRGRFVLLDFWSFCCANCLHVLDELRPFETAHADVLTVIGVHSPKFPHEADPRALASAVERYEVHHPVLNDPGLELWGQYTVRAWPTLVLIDPEGYVVAHAAGEGQVGALDALLNSLIVEYDARDTLHHGEGAFSPPLPSAGDLRFPARAIVLPAARTGRSSDSLLVADAGHHQIVEIDPTDGSVLTRIGSGDRGAPFAEPNGLTLLPAGAADYDVLVADTANHQLRGIRLSDGAILTTVDLVAALADLRTVTGSIPAALSPWDVAWWPAAGRVIIAAAGVHLLLSLDPASGAVEILAGTTVEGLRDGPGADAWLAQPSGLAIDGDQLWFVDAESSALRRIDLNAIVTTVVGEGLFDFGHVDGPAATARLQHPLGVSVLADGSVAVLDTYNGAVRRFDPDTGEVSTLARGLAEPSGAVLVDGDLVVVESAAHHLVRPVPSTQLVRGTALRTERPPTALRAGDIELGVSFTAPPGRVLDDRFGPSTLVTVSASPPELLVRGGGASSTLTRRVRLAEGSGVLQVTAQAATCDEHDQHPACHLARQDWGVPVQVARDGADALELVLLG